MSTTIPGIVTQTLSELQYHEEETQNQVRTQDILRHAPSVLSQFIRGARDKVDEAQTDATQWGVYIVHYDIGP